MNIVNISIFSKYITNLKKKNTTKKPRVTYPWGKTGTIQHKRAARNYGAEKIHLIKWGESSSMWKTCISYKKNTCNRVEQPLLGGTFPGGGVSILFCNENTTLFSSWVQPHVIHNCTKPLAFLPSAHGSGPRDWNFSRMYTYVKPLCVLPFLWWIILIWCGDTWEFPVALILRILW